MVNVQKLNTPRCVDCVAEGITTIRPIATGTRKKRCATHARAAKKRAQINAHGRKVLRTYQITAEQYQALYEAQGGKCAIVNCRATGKVKRLAVDHDHETGEVRGLLCGPHNLLLKSTREAATAMLLSALEYLHNPPARRILAQDVS